MENLIFGAVLLAFVYMYLQYTPQAKTINTQETERKLNVHEMIRRRAERVLSQPAFTCSKLTIETLEKGVKYVQS